MRANRKATVSNTFCKLSKDDTVKPLLIILRLLLLLHLKIIFECLTPL